MMGWFWEKGRRRGGEEEREEERERGGIRGHFLCLFLNEVIFPPFLKEVLI